jgi:hypothetical protein
MINMTMVTPMPTKDIPLSAFGTAIFGPFPDRTRCDQYVGGLVSKEPNTWLLGCFAVDQTFVTGALPAGSRSPQP